MQRMRKCNRFTFCLGQPKTASISAPAPTPADIRRRAPFHQPQLIK
ncbi:hypothetical protein GZL_08807 [Streptomyces sp. 769]|nr:hypothetical protein GZL_08807 [Streptomyces sp. 769]